MKVKKLIEQLQKLNQEADVLLSCDAEGNHFYKMKELHQYRYKKDEENQLEIWEFADKEAPKSSKIAVILWP